MRLLDENSQNSKALCNVTRSSRVAAQSSLNKESWQGVCAYYRMLPGTSRCVSRVRVGRLLRALYYLRWLSLGKAVKVLQYVVRYMAFSPQTLQRVLVLKTFRATRCIILPFRYPVAIYLSI